MFLALGANKSYLLKAADKKSWSESMQRLIELRHTGTVADVVKHLRVSQIPQLADAAEKLELRLEAFDPSSGEEMSRSLRELQKLHEVPYQEILSVTNYLDGHSPFETKHGVKGAEFENVLVIVGRGWNKYNFGKMLENAPNQDTLNDKERATFENNRNLFYVVCSRPKTRLALLFTQELSDGANRPCRFGIDLHQVNIFGITGRRFQVQLVKRCSAPEGEGLCKKGMIEYIHQSAADHKVLLDLKVLHPGCLRPPFRDVIVRDHSSASTSTLMNSFQSASRGPLELGAPGKSGAVWRAASWT